MSELESSNFSTTILTSKSPQQSALLVNEGIQQTNQLINNQLIQFFESLVEILQKQNYEVKQLLHSNGNAIHQLLNKHQEFGMLGNVWDSYGQFLQTNIANNDGLIKFIKVEIISPLLNLINNDIKYSELMINNQELMEIAQESPINEYQWNVKSIQILENFKNYKSSEKNLLFGQLINLFNFYNSNLSRSQTVNESNLNAVLNNYNLDNEMDKYLKTLVEKEYPQLPKNAAATAVGAAAGAGAGAAATRPGGARKPSSAQSIDSKKSNRQSRLFGSKDKKEKPKDKNEKPKLRSKVGSIFGGKKRKSKKGNDLDSIYSNQTTNTNLTNLTNLREDDMVVNDMDEESGQNTSYSKPPKINQNRTSSFSSTSRSAQPSGLGASGSGSGPTAAGSSGSAPGPTGPTGPSHPVMAPSAPIPSQEALAPAQPVQAEDSPRQISSSHRQSSFNSNPNRELPILPANSDYPNPDDTQTPNVVKYSDDSSSDDEEFEHPSTMDPGANPPVQEPSQNEKASIFKQQNLDTLPQPNLTENYLDVNKSRHTQYSFDSGDDLKDFTTSPKIQKSEKFDFPEPDVGDEKVGSLPSDPPQYQPQHDAPAPSDEKSGLSGGAIAAGAAAVGAAGAAGVAAAVSNHGGEKAAPVSNGTSGPSPKAPAPPPARKVAHPPSERRSEIHSQIFHSLPNARDSVIEPPNAPSLVTQNTGNSLISKTDLFNHNQLVSNLIPGLNISNSQVINVNFKQDNLTKATIIGELAFNYQGNTNNQKLFLTIPNKYDKTILNTLFIEKLSETLFSIAPSMIMNKTLGGIKYMENNLNVNQIPVFIHSIWKFEDHQSSLMINLKLNPAFPITSITLDGLVVSVALSASVETTSASSRPTGTFNKEKNRITWRYTEPVTLSAANPDAKLIARFMTNGKGSEDESGIQLKFSIANHLTNESITCNEQSVNCISNLNAGTYSSHN